MSKYTNEIKITIINDILNNLISFSEAQKLLGHIKIDTTMHYAMVN